MQAVILVAGEGKRMLPLTSSRPKGMLPVGNIPIIEHIITQARKADICDFVLVTGYLSDSIRRHFAGGERLGVKIAYRQQMQHKGTGAALYVAQDAIQSKFILFHSDLLVSDVDILELAQSDDITIGVKLKENPVGLGIVEERNGLVHRIIEKPETALSQLVNTGVYLLNKQVFAALENTPLSPRGEIELPQALQQLTEQGTPVFCKHIESWQDISYPWDLLDANAHLLSQLSSENQGFIERNVSINGICRIGQGSIIRSGSYIIGPVVIGDNCDIGPNCFIRAATSIGHNCRIGAGVEIKNSIVMQGSKIPHQSYIGDSVIGEHCNLGAGTKIANMRFDEEPIMLNGINTGRKKLGAILGDGVKTGINVSINAGTIIGNNVQVRPGTLVA